MDWIVEGVAIGGWYDGRNFPLLEREGIEAVLQLHGQDGPDDFPMAKAFLSFQHDDGRRFPVEWLRQGAAFIREQRALGRKVLVLCGAGMSRSVTYVLAYLHEEGMELPDAIRHVARHRRQALPHVVLLGCLTECYGADVTVPALMSALIKERKRLREG